MTPAWLLDFVAALMLAVAAVSAARLAASRPWRPGAVITDTDVAHLLMAIAMAGVLTASLTTLPDAAWEVVFGLLTAWFAARLALDTRGSGWRALAGGHCAPHLAHSAAMLYMFLALAAPAAQAGAMSGMAGMAGMSGGNTESMMTLRYPTLAFAFALILVGYTVWDLDQVCGHRYRLAAVPLAGMPRQVTVTAAVPGGPLSRSGFGETLLAPAVTVGCRVTMGVAMVFMLIIAL
jgi:hypothetical protein